MNDSFARLEEIEQQHRDTFHAVLDTLFDINLVVIDILDGITKMNMQTKADLEELRIALEGERE